MRRARWSAGLAALVVCAGSAGSVQAAAKPCVVTDGPKYSTPGDAASAQYVDMGTQCVDPGLPSTRVTVTPTRPRTTSRTPSTSTGGSTTRTAPGGSAGATPRTSVPPTPVAPTQVPADVSPSHRTSPRHPTHASTPPTTAPVANPDAAPLVAAALSGAADDRGLRIGAVSHAVTTPAGLAVIVAALAAAGLSLRRFIRNRPSQD